MTDSALLVLLKEGNPAAYTLLYERYWKILYKRAYGLLVDEEAAKDIVQTLFISIWQKRQHLVIHSGLESFLMGAVKLQVLNYYRAERVKEKVLDRAVARMEFITQSVEELIPHDAVDRSVDMALEGIPENMKQSFLLRRDNHSIKEIAEKLNLAEQTVSNNLTEIVKRLRKTLSNEHTGEYLTGFLFFITLIVTFTLA